MTKEERAGLLEDEWFVVRHSGEIPEITFHSSLYFLTQESDGPCLALTEPELEDLQGVAVLRSQEIILRDITLDNYHLSSYRGLRRTLYNWHRHMAFLHRQCLECGDFQEIVAQALLHFLQEGIMAAGKTLPESFINCRVDQLLEFVSEVGLSSQQLPLGLERCCRPVPYHQPLSGE